MLTPIEQAFANKAGDRAEEFMKDVREFPDYFLMQGGADGTFSHVMFWEDFGKLMPEIADLAEEYGGRI